MKNNSRAFANHVMLCLLVTLGCGGSIGLGTVWMRHQISTTANAHRTLKAECERLERLIDGKKTVIETEQAPDKLRDLNVVLGLGLVPMNEVLVELVTENTADRLAAKAGADASTDRDDGPDRRVTFRMALR